VTHVHPAAPEGGLLPLLATDAATATMTVGPCRLCERAIVTGQRYAQIVPSGRKAHLICIGRAAAARRSGVPVIR
jgi:hypothetical protein